MATKRSRQSKSTPQFHRKCVRNGREREPTKGSFLSSHPGHKGSDTYTADSTIRDIVSTKISSVDLSTVQSDASLTFANLRNEQPKKTMALKDWAKGWSYLKMKSSGCVWSDNYLHYLCCEILPIDRFFSATSLDLFKIIHHRIMNYYENKNEPCLAQQPTTPGMF